MSPVISHPRPAAARHQFDELSPITITVDCPAKTNLTLEVGPAHDEWGGRHELDTIYCAIGVYDTVTATAKQPGAGFSLELEGAYLGDLASSRSDMRRNHAVLALFAMAQAAEREPDVALTITKRIPVGAGLGGGSADAAATMLAVNRLWDLNWPIERLRTIAATLGADMPFCLTGGLAYGTGFGERITDITPGSRDELALIEQGFSGEVLVGAYQSQLGTPEVYHTFDIVGARRRPQSSAGCGNQPASPQRAGHRRRHAGGCQPCIRLRIRPLSGRFRRRRGSGTTHYRWVARYGCGRSHYSSQISRTPQYRRQTVTLR